MPRYREEVIVPLGRGCIAILSPEEARRLLAMNPELYVKAVKRGKWRRRAERDYERQAKPRGVPSELKQAVTGGLRDSF